MSGVYGFQMRARNCSIIGCSALQAIGRGIMIFGPVSSAGCRGSRTEENAQAKSPGSPADGRPISSVSVRLRRCIGCRRTGTSRSRAAATNASANAPGSPSAGKPRSSVSLCPRWREDGMSLPGTMATRSHQLRSLYISETQHAQHTGSCSSSRWRTITRRRATTSVSVRQVCEFFELVTRSGLNGSNCL